MSERIASSLEGRTIGHFRVLRRLGQGGMGVVYEAEDERLRRRVALKVLTPQTVGDDAARARLLREARTAASIVHRNVATVFEVGEHDGSVFVAMELIPGRSLREVLAAGAMPFTLAKSIAADIARALAKAHDAGIVHRDVKPENVMVTDEGEAKLLDFGIAKAVKRDVGTEGNEGATQDALATGAGIVIGSPAYMSPEQARGEALDPRTDVFSLGVVIHEMLSGENPFLRSSLTDTIAAILRDDPPTIALAASGRGVQLSAVARHCMEKDRSHRFADGATALLAIEGGAETFALSPTVGLPSLRPPRRRSYVLKAAILVLAIATLATLLLTRSRWEVRAPAAAESASGRAAAPDAPTKHWGERALTTLAPGTLGGSDLSPSGRQIAYTALGRLWVAPVDGGEAHVVALPEGVEIAGGGDVKYLSEDRLVFIVGRGSGSAAWETSVAGGDARLIRKHVAEAVPSPDGKRAMFIDDTGSTIEDLNGSHSLTLPGGGESTCFAWHPSGNSYALVDFRGPVGRVVVGRADGTEGREVDTGHSYWSRLTGRLCGLAFLSETELAVVVYSGKNGFSRVSRDLGHPRDWTEAAAQRNSLVG